MKPVYLSLQLAWAFMWRFSLIVSFQAVSQYTFINSVGLRMEQTITNLTGFFIGVCFFSFFPFFATMYWLLKRGVFYRITHRYHDLHSEVVVSTYNQRIKDFLQACSRHIMQLFT